MLQIFSNFLARPPSNLQTRFVLDMFWGSVIEWICSPYLESQFWDMLTHFRFQLESPYLAFKWSYLLGKWQYPFAYLKTPYCNSYWPGFLQVLDSYCYGLCLLILDLLCLKNWVCKSCSHEVAVCRLWKTSSRPIYSTYQLTFWNWTSKFFCVLTNLVSGKCI